MGIKIIPSFLESRNKKRNITSFWECSLIWGICSLFKGIHSWILQLEFGKVYFLSLKVQNISLKMYFPTYHYFSNICYYAVF